MSKLLLKYPFSNPEILITGILSGLAFLPWFFLGGYPSIGLAILLWTVINGYLFNLKYRTTTANMM